MAELEAKASKANQITTMKALLSVPTILLAAGTTHAEFRRFDGPINAASNYIHYSEGFVVTPGYVDISHLVFATADNGGIPNKYIPEEREWDDDADEINEYDDFTDDNNERKRYLDGDENAEIASGSTVSMFVMSGHWQYTFYIYDAYLI